MPEEPCGFDPAATVADDPAATADDDDGPHTRDDRAAAATASDSLEEDTTHSGSPLTGEKLPDGLNDGNGPANLKAKAEIIKFLKDSFALGHRAAATLTTENMLQAPAKSKSTRLRLAEFGVSHAYNHYGQMIEYLRMNGIIPPASRQKSE